ncbi:uncharacterized protein LOC132313453 [Cornus florida]|uniref:uncharacterized protein LOC132313453 n=1 Tax=Cornus florida TaxID=4283 RepID=UPI00289C527F|nr:uncharacterized protein LOC132313453 [Cornus florida]
MANWRSFGDRMLHCRRSILKAWCNCSNPARFHHSTCGGGLLSPVRSSDYFLRRSVGVSKKGANFSSIQCYSSSAEATAADAVVVDEEDSLGGPLRLQSAPFLMLPAGSRLVAGSDGERFKLVAKKDEDDADCYHFFSVREKKVMKMRMNVMLPWQRELLPPNEAICFGSSLGWLAFIHPRNCSLYLFNPFIHSYLPYLPLPPIQTLPCIISSVRYNSNIHTSSSSSPPIVTEFSIWDQFSPISSQRLSQKSFFKKIALSSTPSSFPSNHHHHKNINNNEMKKCSSDSTVMVIQGYENYKLAFCRIGGTAWTVLDGAGVSYFDVIYFSKDQKFYALSTSYKLIEAWDLRDAASPKNNTIISRLPPLVHPTMDQHQHRLRHLCHHDYYLVESSGELLMVVRYYSHHFKDNGKQDYSTPRKTILFDVYKLDFVNKEWLLLPSLGDRALFIGINESLSVSAPDFPGLEKNCIYFTSPDAENLEDSHDLGVFNLEDNSITPIYHYDLKIQLPSTWIIPPQH